MTKISVLNHDRSTTEVDATIYGQLAVHRAIYKPDVWSVSHIATGYAIELDMTEAAAHDVARELQAIGFDFDAFAANGGKKDTPLLFEARACVRKWRGF